MVPQICFRRRGRQIQSRLMCDLVVPLQPLDDLESVQVEPYIPGPTHKADGLDDMIVASPSSGEGKRALPAGRAPFSCVMDSVCGWSWSLTISLKPGPLGAFLSRSPAGRQYCPLDPHWL